MLTGGWMNLRATRSLSGACLASSFHPHPLNAPIDACSSPHILKRTTRIHDNKTRCALARIWGLAESAVSMFDTHSPIFGARELSGLAWSS